MAYLSPDFITSPKLKFIGRPTNIYVTFPLGSPDFGNDINKQIT